MDHPMIRYFPKIYDDIREIKILCDLQGPWLDRISEEIDKTLRNTFIVLSNVNGIENFEKIFEIIASPSTETLEFRRERLLNRASIRAPLTMPWFRGRLDGILGTGKYDLSMDYENQTLTLKSRVVNQNWYFEVLNLIAITKPAVVEFINMPLILHGINVGERIRVRTDGAGWNYRLGTTWRLGRRPFVTRTSTEWETVKLESVSSVTPEFLHDVAVLISNRIESILINDSVWIPTSGFEVLSVDANVITLAYLIYISAGIGVITNIKLMGYDQTVWSNVDTYIPINANTIVEHQIPVTEPVLA